jgi:thiamine-phosphate pyrophosphorylase
MGATGAVMTNDQLPMSNEGKISRIIDANVNRAVEGLRVVEELVRFVLEDKKLTGQLKALRAKIRRGSAELKVRSSETDVGREIYHTTEAARNTLLDIFTANIKRAQEALRVLEEYSKLVAPKHGAVYKAIRFKLYDLEKKIYYPLLRREKLDFNLYVITDPVREHLEAVKQAIRGGVKIIQLRDKTASKAQILKWAKQIARMTKKAGVNFIVNDHIDIAKIAGADGVHVGQDEKMSVRAIRKKLGEDKIIGVSVQNLKQASAAEKAGADYVGLGPIFPTPIKPDVKPLGLVLLRQMVQKIKIPVVAIGGIDQSNIKKVLETGCSRFAVIRAVLKKKNPARAVKKLQS